MYWKKKPISPKKKISKADQNLIKPSPRPHRPRAKRIPLNMTCYLYYPDTDYLVQGTTINISKTGILLKCLREMETGCEVLCLITDKKNLTKLNIIHGKHTLKGRIVRVEADGVIYKVAVQITLGRVDPFAYLGDIAHDAKYWWSRHWQSLG